MRKDGSDDLVFLTRHECEASVARRPQRNGWKTCGGFEIQLIQQATQLTYHLIFRATPSTAIPPTSVAGPMIIGVLTVEGRKRGVNGLECMESESVDGHPTYLLLAYFQRRTSELSFTGG